MQVDRVNHFLISSIDFDHMIDICQVIRKTSAKISFMKESEKLADCQKLFWENIAQDT